MMTTNQFFSTPASIEPILFKLDILSALSLSLLPVILLFNYRYV